MTITTEQEADAALAAVAEWLASQSKKYAPPRGTSPEDWEPLIAEKARQYSTLLLAKARATTDGGCPLCLS